MIATVVA